MADDVSIVIAAQDQASEVLKSIGKNTEKLASTMGKASEQTSKTQKTFDFAIKGFIALKAATMAAQAAMAGITAAFKGMEASVAAFNTQEEVARGMTQAQLDFAASLQVATNIGDEATLQLMKQTEMLGVSKEQTTDLALASAGLGESLRIDQAAAMKLVMQATSGNTAALSRYIPELKGVTDQTEAMAIIQRVASNGLEKLQADADTTKGAMERSAGAFGDLSEKIGALFAPIYKVVHTGLAVFAETLQSALGPAIDLVNNGFEGLQPYIDGFMRSMQVAAHVTGVAIEVLVSITRTFFNAFIGGVGQVSGFAELLKNAVENAGIFIIKALTMAEVAWNNFPTAVDLAVDSVLLFLEGMRADIEHTLTVVIPAYTSWFATNFSNIIRDGFNAAKTVITNFFTVAADLVQKGFTFITSRGTEGSIDFALSLSTALSTNLLDGFEATTEKLPEIAERATTETEKALLGNIGENAATLANEYQAALQPRIDALKASLGDETELTIGDLQGNVDVKLSDSVSGQIDKISSSVQANSAVTGRLITRGRDDSTAQKIAEQTIELRKALEAVKQATEGVKGAIEAKPVGEGAMVEVVV